MKRNSIRIASTSLIFAAALAFSGAPRAFAQQNTARLAPFANGESKGLSAGDIVAKMTEANRERADGLRGFQGTREYKIEYHGPLGDRSAGMIVNVTYKSPDDKEFTVVSHTGSKFLFDHVLKGLLSGEKEASTPQNQMKTALTAQNYDFSLVGTEHDSSAGDQYVLDVRPKTDYKYLYRGKIWVDAKDFAVTRIQAEPAKSPSFWVQRSDVNHVYEKVDGFWLPEQNRTESFIRFGGRALLSIDYHDYRIQDPPVLARNNN